MCNDTRRTSIAVLGCGLMAKAFFVCLEKYGFDKISKIVLIDKDERKAKKLEGYICDKSAHNVSIHNIDLSDATSNIELTKILTSNDIQLLFNFSTYRYALRALKATIEANCNYVDLGGNADVVKEQLKLNDMAEAHGSCAVVNSGLAPGLAEQWAAKLARKDYHNISVLCGGNPINPGEHGNLKYGLLFSAEGLLNEYSGYVQTIVDGKARTCPTLSSYRLVNNDVKDFINNAGYEYFTTSGVFVNTIDYLLALGVKNLSYQTLRYKGHVDKVKILHEFGLLEDKSIKDLSKHIKILPCTDDVLVFIVTANNDEHEYCYKLTIHGHSGISGLALATTAPVVELIDVMKIDSAGGTPCGVFLPHMIPNIASEDDEYFVPTLKYISADTYNRTEYRRKIDGKR